MCAAQLCQMRRLCPILDGFLGVGIQEKNAHTDQMTLFTVLSSGHKIARETLH